MQSSRPFPRDWQQLAVRLHLVNLPGEFSVTVDDHGAPLGVVNQSLFPLAKYPHRGDDVFASQMQLSDGSRVRYGVAVDSKMAESFAHTFFLDVGREDLFVAMDDVLDTSGWWNK